MPRNTLTQSEIDSLISAISAGVIDTHAPPQKDEHRAYDFRRPTKFTKEQIQTLQIIHDNYARIMGNYLAAFLRVPVKLHVVSVAQVTYEEFVFSLPVPTLMTIFNASPDTGIAMLETNPTFVFILIDLLFGGEGKPPSKIRELTDIETTVMRQVKEKFLENLSYVWRGIVELNPQIESMDTNPQFNQIIASSETVALVTISASVQNVQGFINLCFPYITLERVLPKLTAQQWFDQFQYNADRGRPGNAGKSLRAPAVEVKVVLGRSRITLEDFMQLREGDVLALDRRQGEPLEVLVEEQPIFKAQPGTCGRRLGVRITSWIAEEERLDQ